MGFQPGANVYTQGFGSRPENVEVPHNDIRSPTTNDTHFPIGKRWINSITGDEYTLFSISTTGGVQSATWGLLGGTSGALNTLTTDDLTVVTPVAGNINLAGTGSLATTGSGATATVGLVNLTNHNVLVGAGTATMTKVAPSDTSGVALVSQGAAADPHFGTVVVAGGGTGATSLTAHGVLVGEGTSAVTALAVGTNGQVLLGSTGADPAFGTLTTSTGVKFTTGAASLAVDLQQGGYAVNAASTGVTIAVQNAYTVTQAAQTSFALPTTAAVGDRFLVASATGNTSGWIITQAAGQEIWAGTSHTTNGATGTLAGAIHTAVELMCVVANNEFIVVGGTGLTGLTFT